MPQVEEKRINLFNLEPLKLKTHFYYIDESGGILNNETLFIHGCIKTDTPTFLQQALEEVKAEIQDDLYFNAFMDEFNESGFHAVDNHFDIRTLLYRKLIKLNWRAYFVAVNKQSDFYNSIKTKEEHEIFMISLTKLLFNRIRNATEDNNIFIFETIQLSTKSLNSALQEFFDSMNKEYRCTFSIVEKDEEINLAIVDYLNYMLYRILKTNNGDEVMRRNFDLFAPKIALIHIQNTKTYLGRYNDDVTIENLLMNW